MVSSTPPPQPQSQQAASLLNIQNCNSDMTACTFAIRNEDHTIGNVLRHTLVQNEQNVEFAGYSVPHPSEPIVQIRIQTTTNTRNTRKHPTTTTTKGTDNATDTTSSMTAPQVLIEACDTVSKQCDHVLEQLEQLLPYVKDDRLQMEQYYIEQNEEEEEEYDDEGEAPRNADYDDDDEMVEDMTLDD